MFDKDKDAILKKNQLVQQQASKTEVMPIVAAPYNINQERRVNSSAVDPKIERRGNGQIGKKMSVFRTLIANLKHRKRRAKKWSILGEKI